MKGTRIQYDKISTVPDKAKSVKAYSIDNNITIAGVYKRYKKGRIKIYDYQGFNIVVENS